MIYYLTKSSYTTLYQFWAKMPKPKIDGDRVTFICPGVLNEHLDFVHKLFPKLAIKGDYGMKKIEIVEQGNGYLIREMT